MIRSSSSSSRFVPATALLISVAVIVGRCRALLLQPQRHARSYYGQIPRRVPGYSLPRTAHALRSSTQSTATVANRDDDTISISSTPNTVADDAQLVAELGSAFAQKLSELEDYRCENGHCLVPKRYEGNPPLGNWVNKQRQNYRKFLNGEKSSMNEKRISALNKLGFVWNTTSVPIRSAHNDNAWQKMYNQLSTFHAENGHCRVPSSSPLGQWAVRQRFLYRQHPYSKRKSSLTDDRIKLLNELEFPWRTRSEQLWHERISDLHEFRQKFGHVMVPRKYPDNPQLSAWVATQRKNYNRRRAGKASPLSAGRIRELEEMGFVWSYWDYNFMANSGE